MIELKPCPFCGGKAKMQEDFDIFYSSYVVACLQCGVRQPHPRYGKELSAANAWNERIKEENET